MYIKHTILPWQPFDMVRCIFYNLHICPKLQFLDHRMLYKPSLTGVPDGRCSEVYANISLRLYLLFHSRSSLHKEYYHTLRLCKNFIHLQTTNR